MRFGDAIVLAHLDANGALACDLYEETSPGSRQTPLRVAQAVAPVARSAFVITPPPGDAAEAMAGTELLYGSPFCLASNPSLLIDPEDDEMLTPAWFVRSEAYVAAPPLLLQLLLLHAAATTTTPTTTPL